MGFQSVSSIKWRRGLKENSLKKALASSYNIKYMKDSLKLENMLTNNINICVYILYFIQSENREDIIMHS